jgi:hypothetical protein
MAVSDNYAVSRRSSREWYSRGFWRRVREEGEGGQVEDESQTGFPEGRCSQKISGVEAKDNSVTVYSFVP